MVFLKILASANQAGFRSDNHIYNIVDTAFNQGEVQSGYSMRAYLFINQRLLEVVWRQPGYVIQLQLVAVVYTVCS